MSRPILLHIARDPEGRWRVSVGDGATRPAAGVLGADAVADLLAQVPVLLESHARVHVPGADQARTRAEEAVGALLLGSLASIPEVYGRLRELLGVAAGQQRLARVVVDAEDADARALPWELLAAGEARPPLESAAQGAVFRLMPGRPSRGASPTGPPRVWSWTPTPDDPSCQRLAAALRAMPLDVRSLDLADPAGLPPAAGPEILQIIAHGRRDLEAVGVSLGHGAKDAGALAARLEPLLGRVEAVVLAVCAGADATPRELDNLAGRLAAAGATVVISPLRRAGVEALERFLEATYSALVNGSPLVDAVVEGRRALRAWGHPHPQCRWSNLALLVSDVAALDHGPLWRRPARLPGWPEPGADAAPLLSRALELAESDGFIGMEHVLGALVDTPGGGDLAGWLRRVAPPRVLPFRDQLAQLSPQPGAEEGPPVPTPRLLGWGRRLHPEFDLESLATVIAADPEVALALFGAVVPSSASDADPYATMESLPPDRLPLAQGLVVLGGPQDGLILRPRAGDSVGRTAESDGPDHPLYQGARWWDRKLSRDHLRWVGPGRIQCRRPLLRTRASEDEPLPAGEVEVRVGDLLALTHGTRVVGVG